MIDVTALAKSFVSSTRLAVVVLASCLVFLLLPRYFADALWLNDLRQVAGPYVGICAVVSGVACAVNLYGDVSRRRFAGAARQARAEAATEELARRQREIASQEQERKQMLIRRFDRLNDEEKIVLMFCYVNKQQTIMIPLGNGTALSLEQKGFLEKASGMGSALLWPHAIPEWVWDVLQVEFPKKITPADIEAFRQSARFRQLQLGQTDHWAWR